MVSGAPPPADTSEPVATGTSSPATALVARGADAPSRSASHFRRLQNGKIRLRHLLTRANAVLAGVCVCARVRWADEVAGQMENHYSPGRTWEATAHGLLGLLSLGEVLDVGSGDGVIARLLAPRASHITCLDQSQVVIDAARARLSARTNVSFDVGDMHRLPYGDASFDQVLLLHVLTYSQDPVQALREAARRVDDGGWCKRWHSCGAGRPM